MIPHFLYHWLELFLIERKDSFYRSTGHKNSIFCSWKSCFFSWFWNNPLDMVTFILHSKPWEDIFKISLHKAFISSVLWYTKSTKIFFYLLWNAKEGSDMDSETTFWSNKLKEIRSKKHLTQQQLAVSLGISSKTVYRLEHSSEVPSKKLQNLLTQTFPEYFEMIRFLTPSCSTSLRICFPIFSMGEKILTSNETHKILSEDHSCLFFIPRLEQQFVEIWRSCPKTNYLFLYSGGELWFPSFCFIHQRSFRILRRNQNPHLAPRSCFSPCQQTFFRAFCPSYSIWLWQETGRNPRENAEGNPYRWAPRSAQYPWYFSAALSSQNHQKDFLF